MVVIDRDYLTCPEDEIKNIEPLMTILDGRVAYESGGTKTARAGLP
jgi:predicted amidohydrolase YtcJ